MNGGKRRVLSHITGESGIQIIKRLLPEEWVIREYTPDYGIDIDVELFVPYKGNFLTSGEHIYFQVKTTETVKIGKRKVYERDNVEKGHTIGKLYKDIKVVKFPIDTDTLALVEKMSSAVPVLLAVVDDSQDKFYFVCLNDYIEKIIIPEKPDYNKQETITIDLPIQNVVTGNKDDLKAIEWYAKRAKMFSFFNKVNYQYNELQYCFGEEICQKGEFFAQILLRLDVWSAIDVCYYLKELKKELDFYVQHGITKDSIDMIESMKQRGEDVDSPIYEATHCVGVVSFSQAQKYNGIIELWRKMCLCGEMYEDLWKEWFLPTYVGLITSE